VTIGASIELADTFSSRLIGLLGRQRISPGRGILIQPSSGVHTFGLTFPIDVVALDKQRRVLRTWRQLTPFRMTGVSFSTHSCLELAAGQIDKCNIEAGDRLEVVDTLIDRRSNSATADEIWRTGSGRTSTPETRREGKGPMVAVKLARRAGPQAAFVALLALAYLSPDGFIGLAIGSVVAELAIMSSGWN
jgi:uncharacterized protein